MRVPLEVSYHGLSRTPALDELIEDHVTKLEMVCDHLMSCRIGIRQEQKRRNTANPYRIRIEMRVPPNHNIVVNHETGLKEAADDLTTGMKNAFKIAQRRLKNLVEKQLGVTKKHPEQETTALVRKIFREEGYGFLQSIDGDEIYFHRNSVINDDFDQLEVGTGVHYLAELGEDGLQASTVQVIDSSGAGRRRQEREEVVEEPLGWEKVEE